MISTLDMVLKRSLFRSSIGLYHLCVSEICSWGGCVVARTVTESCSWGWCVVGCVHAARSKI